MDALELAYTPHPAFKSRMSAPSASSPRRENTTRGLAAAAVASLALIGGAALTAAPRAAETPEAPASEARPFARRETPAAASAEAVPAPALAALSAPAVPAPVETRPASPLPLAGDILGSEPDQPATMTISASPQEQHVLTSFDGTRTLSNGPVIVSVAAASPRRALARAPVVWNRPLQWVSTH